MFNKREDRVKVIKSNVYVHMYTNFRLVCMMWVIKLAIFLCQGVKSRCIHYVVINNLLVKFSLMVATCESSENSKICTLAKKLCGTSVLSLKLHVLA